jgi:hypothetical protein
MSPRCIVTFAILALAVGCTTAATPRGETTVTQAEAPRPCPLGVDGARVVAEDTPEGAMLTFLSMDKTDELRGRARSSAAMYGPRRAGAGHDGKHAQGGHHGLKPMQMPPAYASTEDIEGGVRMRLSPVDPGDLDALRSKVRERATAMSQSCR